LNVRAEHLGVEPGSRRISLERGTLLRDEVDDDILVRLAIDRGVDTFERVVDDQTPEQRDLVEPNLSAIAGPRQSRRNRQTQYLGHNERRIRQSQLGRVLAEPQIECEMAAEIGGHCAVTLSPPPGVGVDVKPHARHRDVQARRLRSPIRPQRLRRDRPR
jgi:hypothetical protein